MVKIILEIIVYIFCAISFGVILFYVNSLFLTRRYLKESMKTKTTIVLNDKVSMLILIPVLREQNIIIETIKYFETLSHENLRLHLCIAGTKREYATLEEYGLKKSTKEIVEEYCKDRAETHNFTIDFFEADDFENGDRATQLNFATESFLNQNGDVDIIGVYDADSRPSISTLLEVARCYCKNQECSYQQPAFFIDAANTMSEKHENPLLIANAIYQNTWSIISEIPMWVRYEQSKGKSGCNFYCIGHGEFFPLRVYKQYRFPEHQVTDGIQIGYRLGMSGKEVAILSNYCSDDVPHRLKSLIEQHKRWFGGCMRLREAYDWCKSNGKKHKIKTLISGYWSQFRWAYTALLFLINLVISLVVAIVFNAYLPIILLGILGFIYCYLFPLIGLKMSPGEKRISIMGFLLVPFAILVKGIGPNIYILNRLLRKENKYGKVER